MSRVLLADDSPHAQRMGESILREEGYEVVSLTDGETVLKRLDDVGPDLIVADAFLPGRSGLDICRHVRARPRHRHVRIVLTSGLLETLDENEARAAGSDAVLKKPFEASVVVQTLAPLAKEAEAAKALAAGSQTAPPQHRLPTATELEAERVRAAVTLALDAAFPELVREIGDRVLLALKRES